MTQALDHARAFHTSIIRIVRNATGMHETLAVPIATAICTEFSKQFGGTEVYIPQLSSARHEEVIAAWKNGKPVNELSAQFNVSRSTVYRLIGK